MRSKNLTKDLTTGSPMKLLLKFATPMILGLFFQQFYNLVDSIIVGRYLGKEALAGVGCTGSLNFIVLGFCMGICNGFAVNASLHFGARNEKALRRSVANSIWLAAIFSIIITVLIFKLKSATKR